MINQRVLLNKASVIGVLVLFTGIAFIPPINANISKEYFDINTEFYGLGRKHNIQLTSDKAEELDVFFDTLRVRLDNAESEDETIQIFNEGIRELDRYGLLGDMSVKQVQRLIIGRYPKSRLNPLSLDENENRNCLIMGGTTSTRIYGILPRFLAFLFRILHELDGPLWTIIFIFFGVTNFFSLHRRAFLDGFIALHQFGSDGWVWTKGVNDLVSWNGTLVGQIQTLLLPSDDMWAVTGFKGIFFYDRYSTQLYRYIGFARHVKIDYKEEI